MDIKNYDLVALKEKYNTPLYIFDEDLMTNIMRNYRDNFKSNQFETQVIYASKAFNVKEMVRLVKKEGLGLDCVSLGEMYTAINVGFDPKNIYLHGNNKSIDELNYAIDNNIGYIVVDNYIELTKLSSLLKEKNKTANILIRLNVGVSAHTHKFVVTAHIDSKFGVLFNSDEFNKMIDLINNDNNITLKGFHSHIGSQIFDLEAFDAAIDKLFTYLKNYNDELELDIGGGYGIRYTDEDKPIPYDVVAKTLINYTEKKIKETGVKIKKLMIEPGRSIVGEAGYTLYTIGGIKQTPNKKYYFIDGGMTDNIRPALYQAKYDCDVVGKYNDKKSEIVTIAGKCCESGDLIIENSPVQNANVGDLLLVYSTGAYGYSMSNNYNKALTPAVVFISNGKDKLVVKRQTLDDLISREI